VLRAWATASAILASSSEPETGARSGVAGCASGGLFPATGYGEARRDQVTVPTMHPVRVAQACGACGRGGVRPSRDTPARGLDSLGTSAATTALKETQAVKAARRIVARYDADLDDAVKDDNRYDYRVKLFQSTGSKSQSQVFEFVNLDSLTDEEGEVLDKLSQAGKVVTKLKSVSVAAAGTMLPGAVIAKVNAGLSFTLTLHDHTMLWKHFSVRPGGWSPPDGGQCTTEYCLPLPPTKNYVYTDAWVAKVIDTVGTSAKYEAFFGHKPVMKKAQAA
jgi:hypothetical protein